MQNALLEHSAILSTFIKLPVFFQTFVLSIFETFFTVCGAFCWFSTPSILTVLNVSKNMSVHKTEMGASGTIISNIDTIIQFSPILYFVILLIERTVLKFGNFSNFGQLLCLRYFALLRVLTVSMKLQKDKCGTSLVINNWPRKSLQVQGYRSTQT